MAGGRGLVGSAILRRLHQIEGVEILAPTRSELDLSREHEVFQYFGDHRPNVVVLAAAKVGGIGANSKYPISFLTENLVIQNNVLLASRTDSVDKIMFLGSSCIYPRECQQPMREIDFMTGPLEPTNESYAVAKIAGIRLTEAIHQEIGTAISLPMPCNVYGPGDHFDPENSHVLSALVVRFEEARRNGAPSVTMWGTGSARREFIHSDDLADACLFLLRSEDNLGIINVGTGKDLTIKELAEKVASLVGYEGEMQWDSSKPDGMPRKLLDVSKLSSLGWSPTISLNEGIKGVINEYRSL